MKFSFFIRVLFPVFCFLFSSITVAQEKSISGIIIDADTEEPVALANLGVKSKWKGTVTDSKGKFKLSTTGLIGTDTLEISKLGYKKEKIILSDFFLENQGPMIFKLKSIALELPEFTFNSQSEGKIKTIGSLPTNTVFGFAFSPKNTPLAESLGREITIAINPKSEKLLLDTIKISFSNLEVDSVTLRVNAYYDQGGIPGEKFFESLWQIDNQGPGVFALSLGELGVYFEQKSFVSVELVNVDKNEKYGIVTIPVSMSLGSHLVRLSSLGEWTKARGNPAIQVLFRKY